MDCTVCNSKAACRHARPDSVIESHLMPETQSIETEVLQLKCLEVFGGNTPERKEISVPGIDVLVHAHPHAGAETGGDLHYISTCMRGAVSRFMVADVAGHGESVSDLALSLRKLMRKHINTPDQTKLTRALNGEFTKLSTSGRFATAVLATYYGPTSSLILSNAGHPPPLWYSAERKTWRLLTPETVLSDTSPQPESTGNLPLGVSEPTEYQQFTIELGLNDIVVLYTDSLSEAAGDDRRQLGVHGLLQLVSDLKCDEPLELCNTLLDQLSSWRGGAHADDDLTMLVLRHNAGKPPSRSPREWIDTIGRLVTGR